LLDLIADNLEICELEDEVAKKLYKRVREFITYIDNNGHFIPNYGERHRYGETISTAFVESTKKETSPNE
jgi:hypothetical protein